MLKGLGVASLAAGVSVAAAQISFGGSWQESFDALPTATSFSALDDWQVEAVPEPATRGVMIGLAIGVARRRHARSHRH